MTAVRRSQLIRFGVWVGLATVAVLTAFFSAHTEAGVRRIAGLLSSDPPAAVRGGKEMQLANRAFDQDGEQRRINEAIRMLAADRDRLLARVNTLERSLDDVTGSISPSTRLPAPMAPLVMTPPPVASAPATVASAAASGSAAATPVPSNPATLAASGAAAPSPPPAAPGRVTAGHLATGVPSASESVATKTEFGIDLAGNASIEGLRTQWAALKAGQPGLLEGLRPVVTIRESQRPGGIELRLVAGPLANASIAARLCAALSAAGQACQPAVFDGQKLALQ